MWVHAPSQPLMQSPLSRSQTPAASRKAVGFFGSGCPPSCPSKLITRPTSDWPNVDSANPFGRRQFFSLGVVRSRVNCPFLVQFPRRVGRGFVSRMDSITNLPVPSETATVASRNYRILNEKIGRDCYFPDGPPRCIVCPIRVSSLGTARKVLQAMEQDEAIVAPLFASAVMGLSVIDYNLQVAPYYVLDPLFPILEPLSTA